MDTLRLIPLVLVLAVLAGCAVKLPAGAEAPPARSGPNEAMADRPIAYATYSRERAARLHESLQALLADVLPAMREVRSELATAIEVLERPEMLATMQRDLRSWGKADRNEYRAQVLLAYDVAEASLVELFDTALRDGELRAQAKADVRSPMDAGVTGDPLLDRQLVAFEETLRETVDFSDLEAQRRQDELDKTDLVEIFSSFTEDGADESVGGRLLLFVGGDELFGRPHARLVLRCAPGVSPESRSFYQVVRHRIMRGDTIVQDLGWRPLAVGNRLGRPGREVFDDLVVSADAAPVIRDGETGFDQLADMRVVVDMQSAVLDASDDVLGGVDWRIEFRVSLRGEVSWQLSGGHPLYDAECAMVREVLGQEPLQ